MFIIAIYGWQFTRKRDLWGSLSTGVDKLPQRSTFTEVCLKIATSRQICYSYLKQVIFQFLAASVASGAPSDDFTNELENEVQKARDHIKWRTEYMTFLEQLEKEREEGRAEERINTERERARADAAESRANALEKEILELKKQLESLKQK